MKRKTGTVSTVLTLGTIFLAGAYAQRCASVTDVIPTERIETQARQFLGRDVGSAARRFSEASQNDITGYEALVQDAATSGMLALPLEQRSQTIYTGLASLPDSTAYRIFEQRMSR